MTTKKRNSLFPDIEMTPTREKVFHCKYSDLSDIDKIKNLVTPSTYAFFGDRKIETVIKQKFCISLYKNENELIAFVAFSRRPNIPIFPDFKWESWIKTFYSLDGVTAWNSIFISYMVWEPAYSAFFLIHILQELYKEDLYLKHVILISPPKLTLSNEVQLVFTKVLPMCEEQPSYCQYLYIQHRHTLIPKLKIHRATEEESMHYIPIIQANSSVLVDMYGREFFVDLIATYSSMDKVFLAAKDAKGLCVGVMSLAPVKSYDLISNFFDVCPYNGFYKPEDRDVQNIYIHSTECASIRFNSLEKIPLVDVMNPDVVKASYANKSDTYNEPSKNPSPKSSLVFEEQGTEFEIVDEFVTRFVSDLAMSEPFYSEEVLDSVCASYLINLDKIDKDQMDFSVFSYVGRNKETTTHIQDDSFKPPKLEESLTFKPLSIKPGNAFLIEIFAVDIHRDSRSSLNLLEAAFECFRDKDYCLLTQPSRSAVFPLIKYFTRVVTKQRKSFPHELFFIHRNGVFPNFSVRKAHISDFETIKAMILHIHNSEMILNELNEALMDEDTVILSYVFLSENSVVGFTMIIPNFETRTFRRFYDFNELMDLSSSKPYENGLIQHFLLSPIFLKFSPFFVRETLRLSSLIGLYYKFYTPSTEEWSFDLSLISALSEMIAVRPIYPIQYNLSVLKNSAPNQEFIEIEPVSLYYVDEHITVSNKTEINSKIVIVGGSDTAVAFIEHLIFRPSRNKFVYPNITLVASHGLPNEMDPHEARDAMLQQSGRFKHDYMKKLGFYTCVNIVYGTMTDINRTEKMITVNGQDTIYYEYLFLFTGLQYPVPLLHDLRKLYSTPNYCHKNLASCNLSNYMDNPPCNLFLINSQIDATTALKFVQECFDKKRQSQFIVYGSGIGPINCITSLLMFGVPPKRIKFVCQDLVDKPNCFNNDDVYHFVISCLLELNVQVNGPYEFHSWVLDKASNEISTVTFNHLNEEITFDCLGFFCFEKKTTSSKTFNAIINSGIVYNGLIVIDNSFCTNDPCIYAAGPGTQYKNNYFAEEHMHQYYSSIEVGHTVSQYFCDRLETELKGVTCDGKGNLCNRISNKGSVLVHRMTSPRTLLCKLPYGINYWQIYPCGKVQRHIGLNSNKILITGSPLVPQKRKYFSLILSSSGYVKEITCLTPEDIPDYNYYHLYGKHEQLLNNLIGRYENNYIYDFFTFFSQPWAYIIYDEKFPELLHKISSIYEDIVPILKEVKKDYEFVGGTEQQIYRIVIIKELMKFITERSSYLPMYVNYDYLASLQALWNCSPLYHAQFVSNISESYDSISSNLSEETSGNETIMPHKESINSSVENVESIYSCRSEGEITTESDDSFLTKSAKMYSDVKPTASNSIDQNVLLSNLFSESTSSTLSGDNEMFCDIIENTDSNLLNSLKSIVDRLQLPKKNVFHL